MLAHSGQSEAVRSADPDGITTLGLGLTEALNYKENQRERSRSRDHTRYDEIPDAS